MTYGELKQIAALFSGNKQDDFKPFEIGGKYMFRTVTHIVLGRVLGYGEQEILLEDASWIADTGRYHDFLKNGILSNTEVEPYITKTGVGRGAIVDFTLWAHDLPKEQQ